MGLELAVAKNVLTQQELSERWGVHIDTLRVWRAAGDGPAFLQERRWARLFYLREEVEDWERDARHKRLQPRELVLARKHEKELERQLQWRAERAQGGSRHGS